MLAGRGSCLRSNQLLILMSFGKSFCLLTTPSGIQSQRRKSPGPRRTFISISATIPSELATVTLNLEMKGKETPFRAVGQRSIASSFLSASSNPFKVSKDETKNKGPEMGSRVSLSDFLQKKLNETSGLPSTVKGKSKPFSSLVGPRESSGCGSIDKQAESKQGGGEADLNSVVEQVVLEQFKHGGTAKGDCVGPHSVGEVESGDMTDVQGSRKRKSLEGQYERQIRRKSFVVLGGDLKLKQQRRVEKFTSNEIQVPAYNHYANGGGWWDSNMEGVDNEEVGSTEVWEGVGSTTFGGTVDWH